MLRDLLLRLAITDLFRAHWSADIHREWISAVLRERPDIGRDKLENVRQLMDENIRDCLVTGYEPLIPSIQLPDEHDRHVVAAAIRAGAQVIVTYNEKDFPASALKPFGIEAQHPDVFLEHVFDLEIDIALAAVKGQRSAYRNPAITAEDFVQMLREKYGLLRVAAMLQSHMSLI
jgi:hypothetical protein